MPTRIIVSANERLDQPIDPENPDAGWLPLASQRLPALQRYQHRLETLDGFSWSQVVELYGDRSAYRVTADATQEAARLLDDLKNDPHILVMPEGLQSQPLGTWTDAQREVLIRQLRGGWETDPADPLEIVWNPTGGYPLARIAQRYALATDSTEAEIKAHLATLTLRDVMAFLRDFNRKPFWTGTRVEYGAERPGGQALEDLD